MGSLHYLQQIIPNLSQLSSPYVYTKKDTQKHCNFNILGRNATRIYRFINGFYGLMAMPATFRKSLDFTLTNIHSAHAFRDDIKIITKGSQSNHETELNKVLNRSKQFYSNNSTQMRIFSHGNNMVRI